MTFLKQIIALKDKRFIFMEDGVVQLNFEVERTTLSLKIIKLPSCWNQKMALELGYSRDDFAYRRFSNIQRVINFCEVFSKDMKIDFTREVA